MLLINNLQTSTVGQAVKTAGSRTDGHFSSSEKRWRAGTPPAFGVNQEKRTGIKRMRRRISVFKYLVFFLTLHVTSSPPFDSPYFTFLPISNSGNLSPLVEYSISFSRRLRRVASCLALRMNQLTPFRYDGGWDWKKAQAASF